MNRILAIVFYLACVVSAADRWGKVSSVIGGASVFRGTETMTAKVNFPLMLGDRIVTESESVVTIDQAGDATTIQITENSDFLLQEPVLGSPAKFTIKQGEIVANIKKISKKEQSFLFATPTATAAIRGTVFSLSFTTASNLVVLNVFKGAIGFTPSTVGAVEISVPAGSRLEYDGSATRQLQIPATELKRLKEQSKGASGPAGSLGSSGGGSGEESIAVEDVAGEENNELSGADNLQSGLAKNFEESVQRDLSSTDNQSGLMESLQNVGGGMPVIEPHIAPVIIKKRTTVIRVYGE